VGYIFHSVRWSLLLRHNKRVPPLALLGTQVIGFTAVALIGRLADPVRPYLVSKKTGLSLSTQFAVYIVERLFDFGAMALIICSVILLAPPGAMPHPETPDRCTDGLRKMRLAPVNRRWPSAGATPVRLSDEIALGIASLP
jgi:hypothetical protein